MSLEGKCWKAGGGRRGDVRHDPPALVLDGNVSPSPPAND